MLNLKSSGNEMRYCKHLYGSLSLLDSMGINLPVVVFDQKPKEPKRNLPVVVPSEIVNHPVDTVLICSNPYHSQIYHRLVSDPMYVNVRVIDPFFYPSLIPNFSMGRLVSQPRVTEEAQ